MTPRPLLLTLLLATTIAAHAEDDFKPLFDGKSFNGWTGMRGNPLPTQSWTIEDGMIRTQGDRSGGDLRTIDEYSDFDLRFEWRISEKGNSGVKYNVHEEWVHNLFRPDMTEEQKANLQRRAIGFEYQILDDDRLDHSRPDWQKSATGALYLIEWTSEKPLKPVGEWNTSRIVVSGNHGEHWLNGKKLFEFEMGSQEVLDRVKQTKFIQMPGFGRRGSGPIVLTHHGSPVWFRNLRIRAE